MAERYSGVKFNTVYSGAFVPTTAEQILIKELIGAGREFERLGAVDPTDHNGGNVSFRATGGMIIKATGAFPHQLTANDFVRVTAVAGDTVTVQGDREPSSESRMHWGVYEKRPEVRAILHAHDVAVVGSERKFPEVAYIPPVSYGTIEAAYAVSAAAKGHDYIVLEGHGVVALGASIDEALARIKEYHGRATGTL